MNVNENAAIQNTALFPRMEPAQNSQSRCRTGLYLFILWRSLPYAGAQR
ncbi:hypothetical protein RHK13_00865 [Thermosynechococcus sp. HY591]|nr:MULTISPECIES: hypothetical protein [unclassified Thermosynechococcus]WKT83895.1 hypothetical protein QYC28_00865 [Thermosynechococcus sp. HY596]WNC63026.1 hypothetical protein RHK13_00865 [Thermosynechococcus sp. HY591]